MSVEQANIIDFIGIEKGSGAVNLTISDHLNWDKQHLLILQHKLNSYITFVESEEIYTAYPDAKNRMICINIICKFEPTSDARNFLESVRSVLDTAGIVLVYGLLAEDS